MPASPDQPPLPPLGWESGFAPGWEKTLAARDDERIAAMLAGDAARMEAVYAEDLRFGHSIGRVDTRTELIRVHAERTLTWSAYDYVERRFRRAGPRVVLMEGRVFARGNDLGIVLNLDLVFLAVWRFEPDGWKMLAWQSTNRPRPAA